MDRKPAVAKCCSALSEVPEESYSSSQDSSSLSDGPGSCVEFGHVTDKTPASRGLPPKPKYNVVTYPGNSPLIRAVALGADRNASWRKDMEDVSVLVENYGGKEGTGFFGVFDGFHGRTSAELAASELPVLLLGQLVKVDPSFSLDGEQRDFLSRVESLSKKDGLDSADLETMTKDQQMTQVFTRAFSHMDRILGLGRRETSNIRWSGCTSVICVVDEETAPEEPGHKASQGKLHIANCGNIHAVLYKHGRSFRVTKDHSTANAREHKRILKEGGAISANRHHGLVEGLLRATRGLGNYGNHRLRKVVIPAPHHVSLSLDASVGMLVLGSGGLWDGVHPKDVAHVVKRCVRDWRRRHRRHRAKKEQRVRGLCGSKLQETAEHQDDLAKGTENQTSRGGVDDQEQAASNTQPSGTSVKEDTGKSTEAELDYKLLAANICRKLMKTAAASGSRENMSVIVILFQGMDDLGVQPEDGV
ncbi:hypothetical protein ACEWY4_019953 [Coilia grayii]|uniref:PPM-type phosphatase domain-containing protein n=1 Tax=Coilia grayii TaxID=363190 RepID=A0ABD1JDL0_9TELE